jgi:signal peptidase I
MVHGSTEAPATEGAARGQKTSRHRGARGCAVEVIETLVLTFVIFFVIQMFVAQPFQVQQHSMDRTFAPGDYVLVDRLSHLWSPYARGQVIVFRPPGDGVDQKPFIKRVIGIGSDTVEVRDGQVFVNGVALDEPYLFRNADGVPEPTIAGDQSRWIVPIGELLVMGDHRQSSSDSRAFGPIPVSSVIGRGVIRYWPLSAFGIVAAASYDNVPAR